jgi:DNA repair photolyase
MILSVSRRTDIPSFYSEWFLNRLREGFVYVRNPFNTNQISRIELNPQTIECIVFWSKNPNDIIDRLDEIDALGYKYYFQFTITSYDNTIEPNIPKKEKIIETFQRLSEKIGSEKVIWRYDPILLTKKFQVEYHIKWFEFLANQLKDHTHKCIFSFIDMYKKCERNLKTLNLEKITNENKREIVRSLSAISKKYSLKLESCAQEEHFEKYGVAHGKCIDDKLISNLIDKDLSLPKDKNQRDQCGCIASVDIGTYNTCRNFCRYCYANYSEMSVLKNINNHDKSSPLITGCPTGEEKITERTAIKSKSVQLSLFDNKKAEQDV